MKKPVLVIMAAGMGSRYGGLKQIDPVDKEGQIIMDFSIYDAKQAGFEKVVFIIKKENETDFREAIGDRIAKSMEVAYAYQDINNIPAGSTWTATGIGRHAFQLAAAAIVMGGNVRVGFEDNLYLEKGVLAKSNGEMVAKVVRLAKELGRGVANSAEAREILSLPARKR